MRTVTILLLVAAAQPALAQKCPDGTPPPCRVAPRRAAPPPAPGSKLRPYTIVAEFDGTAPAEVRAAAKNLVTSALDESSVLAALPEEQVRLGLALAGKPDTTRLDVETARELAVRGAVRTVFTGTVDRVGQTYHAAVRVLDADSNTVVAARRDIARGDDDLIPTLDRVVRGVRAVLGERRAAIAASRPLYQAATPSFAAYKHYERAFELVRNNDNRGARAEYKEALALDSGFAAAWRGLGVVYSNLGFGDSARLANDRALEKPERLTSWQRLDAEARRACSLGDLETCLAAREQAYRAYGGYSVNLGATYHDMGRDSEAAAIVEQRGRSTPFGLQPIERSVLTVFSLSLGRWDEARRLAASLPGESRLLREAEVAEWTADWAATDSLTRELLSQTQSPRSRGLASLWRASAAAARGRVREVCPIFRCTECWSAQLVLLMVGGSAACGAPSSAPLPDTSVDAQLFAAMRAAAAGDTGNASRILAALRGLPPERLRGRERDTAFAEGLLAVSAGRPAEAVRLLGPLADGRASRLPVYTQPVQWSLGVAYERLGQLDSAVAQLERLATWQGPRGTYNLRGLTDPFAHQRLVLLYARMGRLADARRHWRVFSETFTEPDPGMQHFVDEARAALASAEHGR